MRILFDQTDNLTDRHIQDIPLIHFISFILTIMDNRSIKQRNKVFTGMFAAPYKKIRVI